MALGRPTDYNEDLTSHICAEIASGRSLRSICADDGMPSAKSVYLWLSKFSDFSDKYAKAQSDRTVHWAEEIVEISDDSTHDMMELGEGKFAPNSVAVSRDKLKVDTRKWLMSKMAPKKYGDKVTNEVTGPDGGPLQLTRIELVAPAE